MKQGWIILASLISVVGASLIGLRSCQRTGWERTLLGSFPGFEYTGNITNMPVSTLHIPSHGRLEVYELESQLGPLLVHRAETGAVRWSRLLVAERRFENGRVEYQWVRELRLEGIERNNGGYKVRITCDWDWGGREGGLIDLESDYDFKGFRLSW